jgi:hypothetical protein
MQTFIIITEIIIKSIRIQQQKQERKKESIYSTITMTSSLILAFVFVNKSKHTDATQ